LRTSVYYFTGTGNSLKVAKDLAESIQGSQLMPIAASLQDAGITTTAERVGFVHPLYWYGLPGAVRKLVKRIELPSARYVFSVATCQIPNGIYTKEMESLLAEKGLVLSAGFYVTMPNNYVLGQYEVTPEPEWQELFRKARDKITRMARIITSNHTHMDGNPLSDALFRLRKQPARKHTAWVREAQSRDSHFVVHESCNGCGVCAMVCPVDNIRLADGLPRWQGRCEQCLACTHHCPQVAIQYGDWTVGKERYRHPFVSVGEIIAQKRLRA
jgi:Pyruvate/2-oxoacid:ferredoxin oxidoreductase delta subunit